MGYRRAGFDVVGVDLEPQPSYPFLFFQDDALEFLSAYADEFDAFAASPPCRDHTVLVGSGIGLDGTGWLLEATRKAFEAIGKPWVIENVAGAKMPGSVTLCGSMFGLGAGGYVLQRHRQFLFGGWDGIPQWPCEHPIGVPVVGIYGGKVRNRRETGAAKSRVGVTLPLDIGQEAMGIDWMTRQEMSQAIPPAYAEFIGHHLMAAIGA